MTEKELRKSFLQQRDDITELLLRLRIDCYVLQMLSFLTSEEILNEEGIDERSIFFYTVESLSEHIKALEKEWQKGEQRLCNGGNTVE